MKKNLLFVLFLFSGIFIKAQLSGNYTVPGSFTSVASAVSSLNIGGVSGAVTINIAAAYTETVPVGGLVLYPVSGSSTLNTITFQKSGAGANPILYAYSGGTANANSAKQDGIWSLVGADNISIDGINLQDGNTTINTTMEYGYGFFKYNAVDGCWNNAIRNCTITLNRSFAVVSNYPSESGSRGINMVNALLNSQTTSVTVLAVSGSHSNNKFYANTILNTNVGMALHGFKQNAPYTFADFNNDIGGSGLSNGNKIFNYGGGTSSVSAMGINATAQYDFNCSNNTIDNNTGTGVNHTNTLKGIYVSNSSGANLSINSNSIGLTCNAPTNTLTLIETAPGLGSLSNTISISGNLLSGSGFTTSGFSYFYGISNDNQASRLILSNNCFTNNAIGVSNGNATLIRNTAAVSGTLSANNNTLSADFTAVFNGFFSGVYNTGGSITMSTDISNNFCENLKNVSTGSGQLFLIYNSADYLASTSLNGNVFNNLNMKTSATVWLLLQEGPVANSLSVSNNSITGAYTRTTSTGGSLNCLLVTGASPGTCIHTVANNNFSNISIPSATAGAFSGVIDYSGNSLPYPVKYIYGNVVSNINFVGSTGQSQLLTAGYLGNGNSGLTPAIYSNTLSNVNVTGALSGLEFNSDYSGGPFLVYGNSVYSLTSTGADAMGLNMNNNAAGASIFKNRIVSITSGGAGLASGMKFQNCTAVKVYNNIVGHVAAVATTVTAANGIQILSGTSYSLYNNSVYMNGVGPSGYGSNAIYVNATPTVELINNIFANASTSSGSGVHCAMRRSSASYTAFSMNSNNNLYYAGSPGSNHLIFHNGTTAYQTLASYKAISSGLELNSVTENPPFASMTPSTSTYLSIFPFFGTQIESGAQYLSLVNDDYAGTLRNPVSTDIGAFEGNYTNFGSDVLPPAIQNFAYVSSNCNLAQRVVTVQISDPYVVANGTLSPRLYYKVNNGSYTDTPGSLLSGNTLSGIWSFSLNYSGSIGDVISLFMVAQDVASNVIVSPATGASASGVYSVTSNPTTPLTYTLGQTLNGIYTVGTAGSFTSLTQASNAYNVGCLAGPVTFSLTNALYSVGETFPIQFLNNPDASASNSLLLIPANANSVLVQPSSSVSAVFKFVRSRFISIDGLNTSGSALSINYTYTNATAGVWLANDHITTVPGSNNINIRNLKMNGPGINGYMYGVISANDGPSPFNGNGGANGNNNVSVISNTMSGVYIGVTAVGTWMNNGLNKNWVIANNLIGPAATGTACLRSDGIHAMYVSTISITGNTVQNINTSDQSPAGVSLENNVDNFTIANNRLAVLTTSTGGSGGTVISGIFIGGTVKQGRISANVIDNVLSNASYGYVRGINVATGEANSDIKINNNFISNLKGAGGVSGPEYWTHGIALNQGSGNIDVDFNTIVLSGFFPGTPSITGCSAIFTSSAPSTPNFPGTWNIRNNIMVNTYDNFFSTTDVNYLLYSSTPFSEFNSISNNCYYADGAGLNTVYGYFGTNYSTYQSLINFLGATNSKNLLPVFQATNDLHIVPGATVSTLLDNGGMSLAGITDDIDGNLRGIAPDMGADEFTANGLCSGASGGSLTIGSATICSSQSLSISSSSVSSGIGSSYQWKYSQTSGSSYTNMTNGSGTNSISLLSVIPNPGVYYVILQAACNATLLNSSNEATISVLASAVPTVVATPSMVCATGAATITASGASSYTWNNGSTGSVQIIPSNAQGNYFVFASNANNCPTVISNTATVTYGNSNLAVSATNSLICPGNSATLSASGAATYTWTGYAPAQSIIITPISNAVYTLSGTDIQGCVGTATLAVNIATVPVISITGNTLVCAGLTTSMTASGASTYSWLNTGLTTATNTDVITANTIYTVIGQSAAGCTTQASFAVNITNTISVFIAGSTSLCAGSSLTHSASGGITYLWTTPQGTFNTAVINTAPLVNSIYTLSGSTPSCNGSASVSITVFSPSISVTGNTVLCSGNSTSLTASGVSTYTWAPGGSTLASVSFSPLSTTVYTVSGRDLNTCLTSQTVAVISNSLPVLMLSPASATTCVQIPISFTVSGAGSYTWSNGGGNAATVSFTPLVNTIYTVTGTDAFNACINSRTLAVTANTVPLIGITGNTAICVGSTGTVTASGANTYSWNTGSGTALALVSPSVNTTYVVTGTNTAGCSATASFAIVSNSLPVLSINSATTSICAGSPLSFTATGAQSYTWSTAANSSVITVTPLSNTVYSVTGSNAAGCVASQSIAITTLSLPVISITPASASICLQSALSLTASGAGSYVWSNGGGSAAVASFTPLASTVYTVTGTSTLNGCVNTKTVSITANTLPVLSISGSSALCVGQTTTLNANGASSYSWSIGAISNSIVASPTINTTYLLSGTNTAGCSSSTSFAIVSNSLPVISIVPSATLVCAFSPLSFTASGANSYTWSTLATGSVLSLSPPSNSVFSVNGTNAAGCAATQTVLANTNALPTLVVSPASATLCQGFSQSYTATGASTYSWSNGGGTAAQTTYTPTSSTIYTVTGTNALTGCSNTQTLSATVNSLPVLSVSGSTVLCSGQTSTLTASGAASYSWSSGSTNAALILTPSTSTVLSVTGTSSNSCQSSATVVLLVNVSPSLAITGPTITCPGATVTLTASGASNYVWTNGPLTATYAVTPLVTTIYSLSGTNANGCSDVKTFTVISSPAPSITVLGNTVICSGQSTTLTANGASTYSWSSASSSNSIVVTPSSTSVYMVTGTLIPSPLSCPAFAQVTVNVNPLPLVKASASDSSLCMGEPVILNGIGAQTYQWSGGVINGSSFTPTLSTTYSVSGTDANGCSNDASILVVVNPLPTVTASHSSDTLCEGEELVLTASGANSYAWTGGGNGSTVTVNPTTSNNSYTVIGKDQNNCSASFSLSVVVNACTALQKQLKENYLKIYPNPFLNSFVIESQDSYAERVEVRDNIGRLLVSKTLITKQEEVDMQHFAKGLYHVLVYKGDKLLKTEKLVKD